MNIKGADEKKWCVVDVLGGLYYNNADEYCHTWDTPGGEYNIPWKAFSYTLDEATKLSGGLKILTVITRTALWYNPLAGEFAVMNDSGKFINWFMLSAGCKDEIKSLNYISIGGKSGEPFCVGGGLEASVAAHKARQQGINAVAVRVG